METKKSNSDQTTPIPTRAVGPILIQYLNQSEKVDIPLATYETPLWPSVARGARVATVSGGLSCVVVDDRMTRSILLEAPDAMQAAALTREIQQARSAWQAAAETTSRFAKLEEIHTQQVGNLLYLRLAFQTGDASGHNMATKAAEAILNAITARHPLLRYVSLSANYCSDKKAGSVNGILGRGKYVVAEAVIPGKICRKYLKTSPAAVTDLNIKKNLIGTTLAGGVRSANAHYANMLLAFYLATGQDAANIVEGSQGITHAEVRGEDLYFSVTLPNIIVGSVGNGKGIPEIEERLQALGCREARAPGENARRLAAIAGAAVWCGELSLMAALTNAGELMNAHLRLERDGSA